MKTIFIISVIVIGLLLVVTLGGGLVLALAYGLGWLAMRVAPFTAFEATLLSLVAIALSAIAIVRVASTFISLSGLRLPNADTDDEEDEEDDETDESDGVTVRLNYPGIPAWRQPRKPIDFSNVNPDDRCPCGSGRKFKNCHGKQRASARG